MTHATSASGPVSHAQPGPRLSYDVPQQVSYSGANYIELQLPAEFFIASSRPVTKEETR